MKPLRNTVARARENGRYIFSSTGDLDLIRRWLPQAPGTLFVERVIHRRTDLGEDIFKVACSYPPARALDPDLQLLPRILAQWEKHIAPLRLPGTASVRGRRVHLCWVPAGCDVRAPDELSCEEAASSEFEAQADNAVSIWLMVQHDAADLADYYGGYAETIHNLFPCWPGFDAGDENPLAGLGFLGCLEHQEFTDEILYESILRDPDIWFYFLGKAAADNIKSPLVTEFRQRLGQLRQSGHVPDLAGLADEWLRAEKERVTPATPEQRLRASAMWTIATRLLDSLLSSRIGDLNDLKRLVGC